MALADHTGDSKRHAGGRPTVDGICTMQIEDNDLSGDGQSQTLTAKLAGSGAQYHLILTNGAVQKGDTAMVSPSHIKVKSPTWDIDLNDRIWTVIANWCVSVDC